MKQPGWFWFLVLLTSVSHAQNYRPLAAASASQPGASGEVSLRGRLSQFTDSTGQLTIGQVIERQRAGQFKPATSPTDRHDFGYNTTATHWLFFDLTAPDLLPARPDEARPDVRLMLEIEYANLDELELIEVRNGGASPGDSQSLGLTGDRFEFSPRPYRNNNYVFPIRIRFPADTSAARQAEQVGYFLRVRQPHAILSFFMRLWHRPAFVASDRTEFLRWGIFIGIVNIVGMLSLVLLLTLRDWIYWWYTLYLHFITMHLFSDAGLGFQYLWPTFPRLNEFSPVYLYVWAAMVAQLTFMQYFIHQSRQNSRVFGWITGFKIFVTGALAVAILVPLLRVPGREIYMYRLVSLGTSLFVPIMVGLMVSSLYEKRRDGQTVVRYYGYALAVQFTGYLLVAIINFCQGQGWPLPVDVETYVVLGLTVLADMVFFTYGLTHRYTQGQRHNQRLELTLLQTRQVAQQQVIASLEDEHRRLAQDLHDDVGPLLATAKGYLSRLARQQPIPRLHQAQTLLDEAADELRTLAHQLLPPQLAQTGLVNAIAEATRKLSRQHLPIRFVSLGQVRGLGAQREVLVFSMAVQLIRNAQHHAGATQITVQLLYHNQHLNLSVEDDGLPSAPPETDAANLRAKAALLRADLLTDSTEAGNSVMVSLVIANPIPA